MLVLRSVGHRLPEAVMRQVADLLPDATFEELSETSSMGEFYAAAQRRIEHSSSARRTSDGPPEYL